MKPIKSFSEFLNESYLDAQVDPETLKYDEKKMKKNGYVYGIIIEDIDDLKKDDKVMVHSAEFGELEDESMVTCYKDKKKFIVPKKNIQIELK